MTKQETAALQAQLVSLKTAHAAIETQIATLETAFQSAADRTPTFQDLAELLAEVQAATKV